MSKRSELYDCSLVVHHETAKAWKVSETGDEEKAVWLSKSQCERYNKIGDHKFWEIYEFSIPQWLAEEKGLV